MFIANNNYYCSTPMGSHVVLKCYVYKRAMPSASLLFICHCEERSPEGASDKAI